MTLCIFVLYLTAVLQQSAIYTEATNAAEQKEIVDKHNELRRSVKPTATNMLRMGWDPKIAANARHWAEKCTLSHSPGGKRIINGRKCGENLFMSTAVTPWSTVIQAWYDEEKDFKYGVGAVKPNAVIGHFTQVVWYRSYLLGCYAATCPKARFKYYYVCQYCPAGNVGSLKTPYKSGPPCQDCPSACDNKLCTNPCKHDNIYGNCHDMVKKMGCEHPKIKNGCKASCLCKTEIK